MKFSAIHRSIGLVILYFAVFVLIVVVQFSGKPSDVEKFGGFSVKTIWSGRDATRSVESIDIAFAGFVFNFSRSKPLVFIDSSGTSIDAKPLSSDVDGASYAIRFEKGIVLRFFSAGDPPDRFSVVPTLPEGSRSASFSCRSSGIQNPSDTAVMSEAGGETFSLPLTPSISIKNGIITLDAAGSGLRGFTISKTSGEAKSGIERFIDQAVMDDRAFAKLIRNWIDRAWAGWTSGRYDAVTFGWRDSSGTARFSEKALAAILAEAMLRERIDEFLSRFKNIKDLYPDKLGVLTAPYLGSIIPKTQARERADREEISKISTLIDTKSAAIFERENLLTFLLDRTPYALEQDFLAMVKTLDPSRFTKRQALGAIGCYLEASKLIVGENPFGNFASLAESSIVASIKKTDSGFFFESDDGVDIYLSLLAGMYLIEYGKNESKDVFIGIGQSLIDSALGLSDQYGMIPASLSFETDGSTTPSGYIAPEEIYPLVSGNGYYPHEVSLHREVGPGVWMWTCAPSIIARSTGDNLSYTVEFPVGATHYMTIYGVKPFTRIQLYDINYASDPQFEIYNASGYVYYPSTNTIYLKMKHKKVGEYIRLFF